MRSRSIFACLLLTSLAACEEAFGPGSQLPEESSFAFGHTPFAGRSAGTYAAVGEAPIQSGGILAFGDWAFAIRSGPAPQPVLVEASRAVENGRYDVVTVFLPNGAQGGQTLSLGECTHPQGLGCASMSVNFGFLPRTLERELSCTMRSGTVQLQTLTDERVVGTFRGSLTCQVPEGGGTPVQVQVQGGLFDVAMREIPPA